MLTTLRKQIKSEINSLEKRLESKFNQIDSKLELVLTVIHRVVILMEEQNSRNACSMAMLHYMNRQDRLELHFDAHEKILKI